MVEPNQRYLVPGFAESQSVFDISKVSLALGQNLKM